jgi:hypothetical protein
VSDKNGGVPSGLTMMLKAMGIEFDPKMFKSMADAVIEIRDRLRRIETKLDKLTGETPPPVGALSVVNSQEEQHGPNR